MVFEHRGDPVGDHAEKQAAATLQHRQDGVVHRRHGDLGRRWQQQRHSLSGREDDPAVPAGQPAGAGPHNLTGRGQFIEHGGLIAGHPAGEHERLQRRGGQRRPGELIDRVEDRVRAGRAPATSGPPARAAARVAGGLPRVLPGGQERRQRLRWRGLDLLAQLGQAAAAQHAQHLRIAPLGAPAAGHELALHHPVLRGETAQGAADHGHAQPVALGRRLCGERPMTARVPRHQVAERVGHRLGERHGHAGGQRHAQRVTEPARVLDGRPPRLAADPHLDRPAGGVQLS
jgi:hypothetical protein